MLNTYGHIMIGLEAAAEATTDWPENCGYCSVVRYDPDDGMVWVSEVSVNDLAGKYDVFRTVRRVSPQYIADQIDEYLKLKQLTPQARYDKKYVVQIPLKLNRKTDADIIELLDSKENKQGYIKNLIRQDITKEAQ